MKRNIDNFKKIVIKIGSSLISEDRLLSEKRILDWTNKLHLQTSKENKLPL